MEEGGTTVQSPPEHSGAGWHKGLNSLKSGFGLDWPTPRTSPATSSHF